MQIDEAIFPFILNGAFFIAATIFSVLLNGLFLKFIKTLGIRNQDQTVIRWSSQAKPSIGGITFYIVFLVSIASYGILFEQADFLFSKKLVGMLAATGLAFLMGLSDDAYNTRPLLKLSAQVLCGVILIATGTFISLFHSPWMDYAFTIFWVVAVMNSINMLDNMDAITAIVSIFIVLSALLTISLQQETHVHVMTLIGVLSALIGFLSYNWHPAKMYMGDTGSQFLGIFLAGIGITYFWNNQGLGGNEIPSKQITITLLAFILPIIDTATVTINRIGKGKSPFVGGKDHTTHHLSYLGFSDKQVALIFAGISFISFVLIFIIIKYLTEWDHLYSIIFMGYFSIIFGILYYTTQVKKAKKKLHEQEQQAKANTTKA